MPCLIPVLPSTVSKPAGGENTRRYRARDGTTSTAKFAAHGERFTSVEPSYCIYLLNALLGDASPTSLG